MPTLLITGAAGQVGTALRPLLRAHYDLRLFDRREPADPAGPAANEQVVVGDLCDPASVARAVQGVHAILHLACVHGPAIAFDATVQLVPFVAGFFEQAERTSTAAHIDRRNFIERLRTRSSGK